MWRKSDVPLAVQIVISALMALTVASAAFRGGRAKINWMVIKRYRPIHVLTNIPVILLVIAVATLLMTYVPFMDKNPILWLISRFFDSGDGAGIGNMTFIGTQWKLYAALFLPVLLFALPYLAATEELQFREGTRNWAHGIVRSIGFGLMHMIMLIPFGVSIALIIGGLWFTHQYFKGGVQRSTIYHSVYNTMLVIWLAVSIFIKF